MNKTKDKITELGFIKFVWCTFFHRKHHKRTGEKHVGRVSVSYDTLCQKCGFPGSETIYQKGVFKGGN